MILDFSTLVNVWFPWFDLFSISVFIQFILLYCIYGVFTSNNLYYVLFYMILQIFFFGFTLAVFQLEIFTAFLWLTEVVVLLVCLFILFNTSPSGNINRLMQNYINMHYSSILFIVFILTINYSTWTLAEYGIDNFLLSSYLWDDFYESLHNQNMNDLYGIFLSFYWINSVEFLIVGLVLLIGSLICVQLNKFLKSNKTLNYISFFEIYDFFKDLSKSLFLRKQNLVNQGFSKSSTRSFFKKFNAK